jgi:RNA 2',3'-cyclic 3'-phosphodiesterase
MRLFLAVDLDDSSRQAIAREQERIRRASRDGSPARWAAPEQMHLTLVFIGQVDEPTAEAIATDVREPVTMQPFDLTFAGLGVFPPHGAPRALWIGAGAGAQLVHELRDELDARVRRRGVALEERPFKPHLTLARWRSARPSDRRRVLAHASDRTITHLHVDHASLYHSRLSSAGSTYIELARANLTRPRI